MPNTMHIDFSNLNHIDTDVNVSLSKHCGKKNNVSPTTPRCPCLIPQNLSRYSITWQKSLRFKID